MEHVCVSSFRGSLSYPTIEVIGLKTYVCVATTTSMPSEFMFRKLDFYLIAWLIAGTLRLFDTEIVELQLCIVVVPL